MKMILILMVISLYFLVPRAHAFDFCKSAYDSCLLDCEESYARFRPLGFLTYKLCNKRAAKQYKACKPQENLSVFTCGLSENVIDLRSSAH